jgi:transposase
MRPHGSARDLENRRRKAVRLHAQGLNGPEIARRLNATRQSVNRWLRARRAGGDAALDAKPAPGRPSFLSGRQRRDLAGRLVRGALASGFSTDLWTCRRVGALIRERYGVVYHVDHLPKLLRRLGFTPQKPRRRPVERDDKAVRRWLRRDWPRIKKGRPASGAPGFRR